MDGADVMELVQSTGEVKQSLTRAITHPDQLTSMTKDELLKLRTVHDLEIVDLTGRIETYADQNPQWAVGAKHALRYLQLHRKWICQQINVLEKDEKREFKTSSRKSGEKARKEQRKMAEENHRAKMERIAASNDRQVKRASMFTKVAHEVLGDEMYVHLWNLTNKRLQEEGL